MNENQTKLTMHVQLINIASSTDVIQCSEKFTVLCNSLIKTNLDLDYGSSISRSDYRRNRTKLFLHELDEEQELFHDCDSLAA
jgi:hypothetical protein